jgi:hypothetical protein
MRKWRQNAKMLTALKTLARMGVFKNSCETAGDRKEHGSHPEGVRQNSSWFKRTAGGLRSARSGELAFAAVKKTGT